MRPTEIAAAVKPYVLRWIESVGGGGGPFTPSPHNLDSVHHGGTLADAQAPQFLKADGTRSVTGNLSVAAGITIDGVDVGSHAHSGVAGDGVQIAHTSLVSVTADQHHNQVHSIVGTDHTVTASQYQLVGATGTNILGLLTPSSNPGANAAILRTDTNGYLQLTRLGVGVGPSYPLHVAGATEQVRVEYDATHRLSVTVDAVATTLAPSQNLHLAPAGDITLDPAGNDVLPTSNYDVSLGALNKKFLTLHAAELWVETLVAQNTLATLGGRVLVGPTTTLTSDLAPADTTIYVKHNNLANGDIVYLEANGQVEFMAITSAPGGTGPYSYTVTRNLDGTGANQWYAGDAVFNTGQAGNGFIDLYSVRGVRSGYGPTIVGNVRNSSAFNDWTEHWAVGNLNALYGYGTNTYGAAFGKYAANQPWLAVDATNGIRIMRGVPGTQLAQWGTDGSILIGQQAAGQSNVLISAGAISLRNNTTDVITLLANANDAGQIATFNGVVGISTSGGIFQGTGTFTSPTTALKIYNSGGVGLLEMWGNGTKQVYFDTSGALRAGGGAVELSSNGLRVSPTGQEFPAYANIIAFWDPSDNGPIGKLFAYRGAASGNDFVEIGKSDRGGALEASVTIYTAGTRISGSLAVGSGMPTGNVGDVIASGYIWPGTGSATQSTGYLAADASGHVWVKGGNLRLEYSGTQKLGFIASEDNNHLISNAYYNGTSWRRIAQNPASVVVPCSSGEIRLYNAPSDVAGSVITWTLRMNVLPSGAVAIGSTVDLGAGYLQVQNGILIGGNASTPPNAYGIRTQGEGWFGSGVKTDAGSYLWRLGGYTAGAPAATGYVAVTINGTTYKLLAST